MAEDWRWRSPDLGERHTIDLPGGTLEYHERGQGEPIVFSHGWLSNANLWRTVVDQLSSGHRCITLDLPLGAHRLPMRAGADLTPPGIGTLIADVITRLDLRSATLVGNDSGGAYSQLALAGHAPALARRVARLVLTACETPAGEWPPAPFDGLPALARDAEALGQVLAALRDPAVRAAPVAFGRLHKHPIPPTVSDSYALPAISDPAILRDIAAVMAATTTRSARDAGNVVIARTDLPVLLVWSDEDTVFPVAQAAAFADALPDGRLTVISDSYSFTPEDQPLALARAIAGFVDATSRRSPITVEP